MANRSHECFSSFSPLNSEFSPGLRIIDNYSEHISFNICDKEKDVKLCAQELDNMVLESSLSSLVAIVASDASIKNNVAISIAYIYTFNKPLTKMVHHAVHITSTEAELFAISCSINQSLQLINISKIIVVTDSIHVVKKIFDPLIHPYQIQLAAILSNLRYFFNNHENNSIEFWECPSCLKWHLHNKVNKETKTFNLMPLFPCKNSWDFCKKSKSNDIVNVWKMMFQASNLKGNYFLDLLDNDYNIIELSYVKGGLWFKTFSHLNLLCTCATRAITNHAPTGEYRLRFFSREEFKCSCGQYPIESRCYILHEYSRFNGYWNLRRDSLSHFVMFLETNPSMFSFYNLLA